MAALALEGVRSFPDSSFQAIRKGTDLVEALGQLEGLSRREVAGGHPSNIFGFEVQGPRRRSEEGRLRFTHCLQQAGVVVSTGIAGYGQEPAVGDQQKWPSLLVLTINPTVLRRSNATLLRLFEAALQEADDTSRSSKL